MLVFSILKVYIPCLPHYLFTKHYLNCQNIRSHGHIIPSKAMRGCCGYHFSECPRLAHLKRRTLTLHKFYLNLETLTYTESVAKMITKLAKTFIK